MDGQRYLRNVVSLDVDREKCTGCGMCVTVCPHAVFEIHERKARIMDRDGCMECGACGLNCPVEAISVDSGVGCATAVIMGALRGTEPTCDCNGGNGSPSCCG